MNLLNLEQTVQYLVDTVQSGIKIDKVLDSIDDLPAQTLVSNIGKYYLINTNKELYLIQSNNLGGAVAKSLGVFPKTGPQGIPGQTGPSPTITIAPNGNWIINGVDTGRKSFGPTGATGPSGITGKPGAGIKTMASISTLPYEPSIEPDSLDEYDEYLTIADFNYYDGNILKSTPVQFSFKIKIQDQIKNLRDVVDNLTSLSISDNMVINSAIQELYISGADVSDVDEFAVNKHAGGYTVAFKKNGSNKFTMIFPLTGDFRISSADESTVFGIAVFNSNFDSLMLSSVLTVGFNVQRVTSIEANPLICEEFFGGESAFSPSYTKTTSKRISTDGKVVDAGSSWFYSSPISVKSGDIVNLACGSNSSASPLSLTDSTGSFYTPVVTYTGTDPDNYTYQCKKDGYVCFSASTIFQYRIYVLRQKNSLSVPLYKGTENSGKLLSVGADGLVTTVDNIDFSQIAKPNKHSIHIPTPVRSAPISAESWTGIDTTIDGVYDVFDNVNNVTVKAVKGISTNDGALYCDLSSAVDATQYAFQFSLLLDPEFDVNTSLNGRGVFIVMYSGSGRSSNNRWTQEIQTETGGAEWDSVYNRDGWWHMTVCPDSCPGGWVGGSFDMTAVTAVGVKVAHASGTTRGFYISNMSFVPRMQRPGIVTIIDNFDPNVPAMADYAYSKGVTLNLSIIPGFYEGDNDAPTCASLSELERVAEQGYHFIWNHTWSHRVSNNLTEPQLFDQINYPQAWMNRKGYEYSRGSRFISVPSAKFNTASCNSFLKTNAEMIFHAWVKKGQIFIPYYPGLRQLQTTVLDTDEVGTGAGTTLAGYAENAITYGGLAIIGFHGTFWARDDGDSWKEYIDAIAELDTHHYTIEEIYKGMWC